MKDGLERIMKRDNATVVKITLKVLNPNCAIAFHCFTAHFN
jgi:hypothetical protein